MDRQDLFDALTIRFSDLVARRDVLRTLGTLALAMLVFGVVPWRVMAQDLTPDSQLAKGCKLPGQKCTGKNDCRAHKGSGSHRCHCSNKGGKPLVNTPLGPTTVKALCCSNKLN